MAAHALSESLPAVDAVAAQLHNSEVMQKKNAGKFTDKLPSGEETMVPFEQLSDGTKAAITDRVRVIYAAIDLAASAGEGKQTRKAG